MKKSRYRVLVTGIIIAAVLATLLLYFRPMKMSGLINENQEILITRTEFRIQSGEAYTDYENYNDLTEEQRQDIIDLFQQYTYRRTPGTLFSDGSLSGLGDEIINIFVYKDSELLRTICISDTGSISVNNRSYVMRDAPGLIRDLSGIIE